MPRKPQRSTSGRDAQGGSDARGQKLAGTIAVVAGATRGAGRGIARALAEAGAKVYCTGRSLRGNPSPYNRPETIEETAEMISAAGGSAVALRVDHTVEAEVEALFQRVDRECGRLDLLVNSIAGENPLMAQWCSFWKTDLKNAEAAFRQSLLSHIITAKHAAPDLSCASPKLRSTFEINKMQKNLYNMLHGPCGSRNGPGRSFQ